MTWWVVITSVSNIGVGGTFEVKFTVLQKNDQAVTVKSWDDTLSFGMEATLQTVRDEVIKVSEQKYKAVNSVVNQIRQYIGQEIEIED